MQEMGSLNEFSEQFRKDPVEVNRTEKARKVSSAAGLLFFVGIIFSFILLLDGWESLYTPTQNLLAPAAIVIGFTLNMVVTRTQIIYSDSELALHYLSEAIRTFEISEHGEVVKNLTKFNNKAGKADLLPDVRESEVERYIGKVAEAPDQALEDTFEEFFETISIELMQLENSSLKEIIEEIDQDSTNQVTYRGVVRDAFSPGGGKYDVPFWTFYVVVIIIGTAVFLFYNEQFGYLLTFALLTGLQLYDRRRE